MGINDYGQPGDPRSGATSMSAWAASVAQGLRSPSQYLGRRATVHNDGAGTGYNAVYVGTSLATIGTRSGDFRVATLTSAATLDAGAGEAFDVSAARYDAPFSLTAKVMLGSVSNNVAFVGALLGARVSGTSRYYHGGYAGALFFGFQFSTLRGDTNWQFVYGNAAAEGTTVDTGIPASTASWHVMRVVASGASSVSGTIDGTSFGPYSMTSGFGTTGLAIGARSETTTSSATSINREYMELIWGA